MKPVILSYPGLGPFEAPFGPHFEVLRLPGDATERAAALAARGPGIRAAIIIGSVGLPPAIWDGLPDLELLAVLGAGYDGVDLARARSAGVAVTNCPAINHEDVADVALGLMISVMRGIAEGDRLVRAGAWTPGRSLPLARRIAGRKLGIVGLGAIGEAIGRRGAALGMEIAWTGPRPKESAWRYVADLRELAAWSDVLALALRPDPGTERMIDAKVLDSLGPKGVLINVSRGSVVDEDALIDALKTGRLGGAGLDVFAQEPTPASRWADAPNVSLMPHVGGGTIESIEESVAYVLENMKRHFAGAPLLSRVA